MAKINIYQRDNGIKLYVNITKDNLVEIIVGSEIEFVLKGVSSGETIVKSTNALDTLDKIEITDGEMAEICITLWEKDTQITDAYTPRITTTYSNGTKLTQDEIIYDGSKMILIIKQPKVAFQN